MDPTREQIFELIRLGQLDAAAKLLQDPDTSIGWALGMASQVEDLGDQHANTDKELALWCYGQALSIASSVADALRQPAMSGNLYAKFQRLKAGLH